MRSSRWSTPFVVAALGLSGLSAGCGGDDDGVDGADTTSPSGTETGEKRAKPKRPKKSPRASSSDAAPAYSDWVVGAEPLPLRPDGYGVMGETPRELRVRRLPTRDLLPPPAGGRFASTIGPVTDAIRERMGRTWTPECPVALEDLAYVTVSFRGFDGRAHTGELVVAASEAEDVVSVFEALFRADFPLEEMRLVTNADLDAAPTGDGNNTAGLVCRATRGSTTFSAHAYGLAIDVNPFLNPYLKDDVLLPERARSYLDRDWRRPGMVFADSVVVREFARIGWTWGGDFDSLLDYQHFTATGR